MVILSEMSCMSFYGHEFEIHIFKEINYHGSSSFIHVSDIVTNADVILDGTSYFFYADPVSWDVAREVCLGQGRDLLTIDTDVEWNNIYPITELCKDHTVPLSFIVH